MNPLEVLNSVWRSMGIVRKFAVALGSMLALILFVAAVGFVALQILADKAGEIVDDSMHMQRLALEVDSRLQLARQAERDFVLRLTDVGTRGARTVYAEEFAKRIEEVNSNISWLKDMELFSEGKKDKVKSAAQLVELRVGLERYSEHFHQLVDLTSNAAVGSWALKRKIGEMDSDYLHLSSIVRQLVISVANGARNAREGIADSSILVKYILVFSVFFALLLAASIMWVLDKTIVKSAISLSDAATELSLGNLEARASVNSDDELGQLAGSINAMAKRITSLVDDLEGKAAIASDRLVEAIDSISESFMLYDRNSRLVLANNKLMDFAGQNAASLNPGTTAKDILHKNAESGFFINAIGRESEWVEERLRQHANPGPPVEELLADGRWLLIKTYRTGLGEVVVVMSEITEMKRKDMYLVSANSDLEDLVRERTKVLVEKAMELKNANARLKELDELKSAFLSSVSHELRTPLTSLLGFSKIIKRDFSRIFMPLAQEENALRLGSRIQSNLDIIGSEGERLTRLINDVLDLSRIESGQDYWRFTEVDLAEAIHSAMESASGLFSSNPAVKLTIRRFDMVPLIHADPDRLHQVLLNLLSNASKFTDFGEVAIDLYLDERDMVRLIVEDSGRGIDPQSIEQIFDKFHQAQNGDTLTEKPTGTGLGLAICRQIIEYYGGRIWAESKVGHGTRMCIALPVAEPVDRPLILVVDDDQTVLDYLSMILKKAGYGVRTACDGHEALALASRQPPSLITMDILMPGMDGRVAIRKLRENQKLASIPILVVSVLADCHISGGDAALLKPVDSKALLDTVHGLLGDGRSVYPMLVLGGSSDVSGAGDVYSNKAIDCSESEMWEHIGDGFEGMVLMPENMAADIDLVRLCDSPSVQVLLLPRQSPVL